MSSNRLASLSVNLGKNYNFTKLSADNDEVPVKVFTNAAFFFLDTEGNLSLCCGSHYPFPVKFLTIHSAGSDADDTILAYRLLQWSTSRFVKQWKEVSLKPLASLQVKLCWKNFFTQWKSLAPTVTKLCLEAHKCSTFFVLLWNILSNLPLCGGSQRKSLLSVFFIEKICKIGGSHE